MSRRQYVVAIGLVAAGVLQGGNVALADDKQACLDASNQGQILRDAHKLVEAREAFQSCGRATCPLVVQNDCLTWLDEVSKAIPSLALTAKDGRGNDLIDVAVTLDGAVVATRLDGRAIEVNAGAHALHFELADGTAIDEQVLVTEGEKNRVVEAVLGKPAADRLPETTPETAKGASTRRTIGLALGGAGLVGIAVGTVFGLDASSKWSSARADCKPGACGLGSPSQNEKSDASRAATASTIAFVAGGVGLAAGSVLFFTAISRRASAAAAHGVHVAPSASPSGAAMLVWGTFE